MAARGEIPNWAQTYVTVLPNNVRVAPEVRACVELREGSAPAALFGLERGSFDAVFCRNLAIYLSDAGRRAIGEQLDALLHADGILYLGHAERPALFGLESGFESVQGGQPGAFAFARRSVATPVLNSAPPVQTDRWEDRGRAPLTQTSPARPATIAAPKPLSSNAAAARTPVTVTSNEPTESKMLQSARAAADAGDLHKAADIAERIHSTGDRSLALMELMGSVHLGLGDVIRAESAWRQVVYLDPQNVEALLHLAILADRRGDAALAQRYRVRAAKGTS
jgi:chemotaxis protein methyltransferase WspC